MIAQLRECLGAVKDIGSMDRLIQFFDGYVDHPYYEVGISYAMDHVSDWSEFYRWHKPTDRSMPPRPHWALADSMMCCKGMPWRYFRDEALGSPYVSTLRRLLVDNLQIGDEGLHAIATNPHLGNLECLTLNSCEVTDVRPLARSKWVNLTRLGLSGNPIGDEGAMELAYSEHMSNLKALELSDCRISSTGVVALMRDSSNITQLERLDLSSNRLQLPALVAIAESNHVGLLTSLDLYGVDGVAEGYLKLYDSPKLPTEIRRKYALWGILHNQGNQKKGGV